MNIIKVNQIIYFQVQIKGSQTKGVTKVSKSVTFSYERTQLLHKSGVPAPSVLRFLNTLYADFQAWHDYLGGGGGPPQYIYSLYP
jgi:hypothetical protein